MSLTKYVKHIKQKLIEPEEDKSTSNSEKFITLVSIIVISKRKIFSKDIEI